MNAVKIPYNASRQVSPGWPDGTESGDPTELPIEKPMRRKAAAVDAHMNQYTDTHEQILFLSC